MRRGRRLGVDLGDARIGVAVCDPDGLIATPVETVPAGPRALTRLAELAGEYDVLEIVVGLPLSLSGRSGPAADKVRLAAADLARLAARPVRLSDERLSTVTASAQLRAGGRTARTSRTVIDQAAATVILQTALDAERTSGRPPGDCVDPTPTEEDHA